MEKYAEISALEKGIFLVRFTGAKATEENFTYYLEENLALYNSKETLSIIFDASNAALPGFSLQRMQANWLKNNEDLMKSYCKGTAYVIQNPITRGILQAIFALQGQPIPYTVVKEMGTALDWCRGKMG
ncbi:MAG: STAS/SEC14 domain-containing protein [Luteibaculaceae bacterium]